MTQQLASLPRLPKYDVLEEIGHGGMATVYRALDNRLGREVAVKIIHRHLRESPEVARRFVSEARAVAKLRHPNIVEIFDVSEDDVPERFLVAELVRGKSLRRVLEERKQLPPEVTAAIGLELCDALAHAHEKEVVHRDVKPENVLFGTDEPISKAGDDHMVIKLTDFGIAKMLDQQGVTVTGQVLGSPAYMSPEQIECGDVDPRSDVFSLGVLLYECMVGHLPFEGKNPAQVLHRVLEGEYPQADHEEPRVGARWAAILAKSLARDQAERFASMTELRAAIAEELASCGITDPRGEVSRYFSASDDYAFEITSRLVPRLVARGRAAHERGDVVDAAGQFNRALAYAPGDAAILAHVTGLSRDQARKQLLRRAGLVLVGTIALGCATWGIALGVKRRAALALHPTSPAASIEALAITADSGAKRAVPLPSSSSAIADRTPTHVLAVPTVHTPNGASSAKPAADREVHFIVNPKSALLSIDGGGPQESDANTMRMLSVGQHTIVASVRESNPCCKKATRTIEVIAAPDGSPPQVVSIMLPNNPAHIVSSGGPPGARIECPTLKVFGKAKGSYDVEMGGTDDSGSCSLYDNNELISTQTVVLQAGKSVNLAWPSSAP